MMNTGKHDLQQLVAGRNLPALPQSAISLLELAKDQENGPAEFATPIELDPGLAAQVLKFVNSSYFAFSQEVTSIRLAITLVGVRTIKNFALWNAIFSLIPNPQCGPFDLRTLWQDSLRRALFARTLAAELGVKDAEEIFTAALLQDMAIPLLAKELPREYTELLQARKDGQVRLSELEQERFGWSHADAAALMAAGWRLPPTFTRLLKAHVNIDAWRGRAHDDPAIFAIGISSLLPTGADTCWHEQRELTELFEKASRQIGGRLRDVLVLVDEQYETFAPIIQLDENVEPLAEMWDAHGEMRESEAEAEADQPIVL